MKKNILLLLTIICMGFISRAEVIPFPDLENVGDFVLDDKQIYISTSRCNIHIYSLTDFKPIKTFGKKGEGPQEFKRFSLVSLLPDKLLVNSLGKVSYFTKSGTFIREIKAPGGIIFQPIGENFVAFRFARKDTGQGSVILTLYNRKLEKIRDFAEKPSFYLRDKGIRLFNAPFIPTVSQERIWWAKNDDFEIDVFESSGKKISTIKNDYKRVKVTEDHKKQLLEHYNNIPRARRYYEFLKAHGRYPDHFPAIRDILVDKQKIYVLTFKEKAGKTELLSMDFQGKPGKTWEIPFVEKNPEKSFENCFPFQIRQGKFYQLIFNENQESWELHIIDLK